MTSGARHGLKIALTTMAVVAASMTFTTGAAGATSEAAMWSTSTSGNATTAESSCGSGGPRSMDDNHFCVIDDFGAVELGVRFTSAKPVLITGVRVYRVDAGTVTGSLWDSAGVLKATGTFEPRPATGGRTSGSRHR